MKIVSLDISKTINEALDLVYKKNALFTYDEFLASYKLSDFKNTGVVYFIYSDKELKYIGKSRGHLFRQRMRNHFVYKNKKTGSKLEQIENEKAIVRIGFFLTEPESLRNCIEEELILCLKGNHTLWNRQKG